MTTCTGQICSSGWYRGGGDARRRRAGRDGARVNRATLKEPAGGDRRRALGLLAAALVLSMTTWFSASAVIPQLRVQWHLSSTTASWLTIAVQLGFVVGALISSVLNVADIMAASRLILAGSLGAAAANVLLVIADGSGLGIPLRFATGLFLAGVYPPALKLMSTWYRSGRGVALGTIVGALTIGSARSSCARLGSSASRLRHAHP